MSALLSAATDLATVTNPGNAMESPKSKCRSRNGGLSNIRVRMRVRVEQGSVHDVRAAGRTVCTRCLLAQHG